MKLALIGKNITHSKSQQIYEKFLGFNIDYTLIDCSSSSQIPSLDSLCKKFSGISITSPYKQYFTKNILLDEMAESVQAVNCIKKENGYRGTNTDLMAVDEQMDQIFSRYGSMDVFILGDGVMSRVIQKVLHKKGCEYTVLSRKKNNLHSLDFSSYDLVLVVNCCSRDYVYKGGISKNMIFLDCNYEFSPHENLGDGFLNYMDGKFILERQAFYALKFWRLFQS